LNSNIFGPVFQALLIVMDLQISHHFEFTTFSSLGSRPLTVDCAEFTAHSFIGTVPGFIDLVDQIVIAELRSLISLLGYRNTALK
jgi:hypothetical protein